MSKAFFSILVSMFLLGGGALAQAEAPREFDPNEAIENAALVANISHLREHSQEIYNELQGVCSEYNYTFRPPFVEWLSQSQECMAFRTIARSFLMVSEIRLSGQLPVLEKHWKVLFNSLSNQCTKWKFVFGDSTELAWNDHSPNCEAFRQLGIWYLNQHK